MHVPGLSTNGIKLMHEGIRSRLAEEDAMPTGQTKEYGIREHADFREMADEFEAELTERGVSYSKIAW